MHFLQTEYGSVPFSIPDKCPNKAFPLCPSNTVTDIDHLDKGKGIVFEGTPETDIPSGSKKLEIHHAIINAPQSEHDSPVTPMGDVLSKVSSSPSPWSKTLLQQASNLKMGNTILSDEEIRKSRRNQAHNQGYKAAGCRDKNYIGCSITPPTLSPSVIKNLRAAFFVTLMLLNCP